MPKLFGIDIPDHSKGMKYFDVEVFTGTAWMSLNDNVNYRVNSESLNASAQQRKRQTVTSEMYDGEFLVHSTLANITENVVVYVLGMDQSQVSTNLSKLIDVFSQDRYNIRVTRDDALETWLCQPADWSTVRSQVESHNIRATVTLQVNRFPQITYEVRA